MEDGSGTVPTAIPVSAGLLSLLRLAGGRPTLRVAVEVDLASAAERISCCSKTDNDATVSKRCTRLLLSALPNDVCGLAAIISAMVNSCNSWDTADPSANVIVVTGRLMIVTCFKCDDGPCLLSVPLLFTAFITLHFFLRIKMTFDSPTHRDKLRKLHAYVSSATFLTSSGWALAKTGHMLVEKPSGTESVAIGVAKVLDHKLLCGPVGNYNPKFKDNSPLEKAKYSFTVGRPDEPAFQEDYDKMYSNLDRIQNSISYDKNSRNLLDPLTKTIRFSCPIFVQRVCLHLHR